LQHGSNGPRLRSELIDIGNRSAEGLGFSPRLHVRGEIRARLPITTADDILAVVREALSNVARHAAASAVDVSVDFDEDEVRVAVTDDGRGIPASQSRRSGLRNLADRAEASGGTFEIKARSGGGTELVWVVPMLPTA
jgi:signal transduction histidine kinase